MPVGSSCEPGLPFRVGGVLCAIDAPHRVCQTVANDIATNRLVDGFPEALSQGSLGPVSSHVQTFVA